MRGVLTANRLFRLSALCVLGVAVSACSTTSDSVGFSGLGSSSETVVAARGDRLSLSNLPMFTRNAATSGEESFSSAAFGVAASPRVTTGLRVQRGGGRDMVGKPYTIRGRTYHPTANPEPVQHGRASWYGQAFHGRKTANGEIYDMNHLTAAHKTMPLPSYARVTNKANGRSVVVRVNDRGPFSDNRVIDLSKRAAYMLDFISRGTADVKVEYLGRAPLDGNDDAMLIASFEDGGVPSRGAIAAPQVLLASNAQPADSRFGTNLPGVKMPRPVPRPDLGVGAQAFSAYADWRVASAFDPAPALSGGNAGWKRR